MSKYYIIYFNIPLIDGDASQTVEKFKRFITPETTFQRFLLERLDSISFNFVYPMCIHTHVQVFRLLPLMKQRLGTYASSTGFYEGMKEWDKWNRRQGGRMIN